MALIGKDKFTVIVGLGKTGLSCARFLAKQNEAFGVVDTRVNPPGLDALKTAFPNVPFEGGALQAETLKSASRLVLSPGVPHSTPAIEAAAQAGVEMVSDIDLFCEQVTSPVVAITGSNAKSTVTTLVTEMAKTAGMDAVAGGNLGTPALDLLPEEGEAEHQLYILELSSFQLEITSKLKAAAACVLNVSPDHMDRYSDLMAYQSAKQRIYCNCLYAVYNKDDALTQPLIPDAVRRCRFGLGAPDLPDYGVLVDDNGVEHLAKGLMKLMPVSELKMPGRHNLSNALAALAIGQAVYIPEPAMLETLREFPGLEHRCQWVRKLDQVNYYNDSKGTNVGATVAAIDGLASAQSKVVLIAGGDGKGADFSELQQTMQAGGRAAVLIGRDAKAVAAALPDTMPIEFADSLADAVAKARVAAQPGDVVLLSPACASFDMFNGFEDRGNQFMALVRGLA